MIVTYLNTTDNLFLDQAGDFWRDKTPELTVRGNEKIIIHLVADSPDYGTAAADPASWQPDDYWKDISGISAMLTIDNDYRHRIKGVLSGDVSSGAMAVSITFSTLSNFDEIPISGIIALHSITGATENISYTFRTIAGKTVTFQLGTAITGNYASGSAGDVKQSPLCLAYLSAEKSDWQTGKLVFELAIDSTRLRALTEYSDSAAINIDGIELLFYVVSENNGEVILLRRFLWDTPSLVNTMGDPGYPAPVPDSDKDYIASEIARQLAAGGGGGSGMTEAEIKEYVDQQVAAKFEELSNAEW
jgi:hypothetical protein